MLVLLFCSHRVDWLDDSKPGQRKKGELPFPANAGRQSDDRDPLATPQSTGLRFLGAADTYQSWSLTPVFRLFSDLSEYSGRLLNGWQTYD